MKSSDSLKRRIAALAQSNAAVARAFHRAGLRPAHINDWIKLAVVLADELDQLIRARGRPEIWDLLKLGELLRDAEKVEFANWEIKDASLCRILRTNPKYKPRWGRYSGDYLRKRLREARRRIIDEGEEPIPKPDNGWW